MDAITQLNKTKISTKIKLNTNKTETSIFVQSNKEQNRNEYKSIVLFLKVS